MTLRKIRYRATMVALLSSVFLGGLVAASTISRTSLRPVPFRNANELVQFIRVNKGEPNEWSADSLRATAALTPEVFGLAWFTFPSVTRVRVGTHEVTGSATIVSSDFFSVLGVSRGITLPHASDLAVVTRRFASTLGVAEPVGASMIVGQRMFRIAAVLPDDDAYPTNADIWYAERGEGGAQWAGLARLREGMTVEEAGNRLSLAYKTVDRDVRSRVLVHSVIETARPTMTSDQRSLVAAIVLFGAIGVLNFALLGIGESRRRIKEYAIRIAVGASPTQISREVALEQVRIIGIALGIAVVLLVAGTRAALPTLPLVIVIALTLGFGLIAVAALLPVGVTRAATDSTILRRVRARGSHYERRWNQAFVAIQFGVTAFLLVAGGIAATALDRAKQTAYGFDPDNKIIGTVWFMTPAASTDAGASDAAVRLIRRLAARIPDAKVAALGVKSRGNGETFTTATPPTRKTRLKYVLWMSQDVTPNFFDALGLRIIAGRAFRESDDASAEPAIIITETAAQNLWGVRESIGQRIQFGSGDNAWRVVVGVVADSYQVQDYAYIQQSSRGRGLFAIAYRPLAQVTPLAQWGCGKRRDGICVSGPLGLSVLIAGGDQANAIRQARLAINEVLPGEEFSQLLPATEFLDGRGELRRGATTRNLLIVFALIGFMLAVIGAAVMIDEIVRGRTNEIGIRMALGARALSLIALVSREQVIGGVAGAMFGTLAGAKLGPILAIWMKGSTIPRFRQPPPVSYELAVATLVLLVVLIAAMCALRGMRAARLNPVEALRAE